MPSSPYRRRRLAVVVLTMPSLLLVISSSAAATYDFVNIADTHTPIPGGTGNFTQVVLPSICGNIVAF